MALTKHRYVTVDKVMDNMICNVFIYYRRQHLFITTIYI